ncbi:UDP-galactopyranose mutase [Candidatus Hydrogenisulfobacillus filiaventi]|uniref:UDP-galactopyranose mutase n=1 Tax=Candidatus Hydrogenisulfobacillus filiaventi TaxID=2707344 RepID=A0A6F8ZDI8_9FIRM|nr:UDP-galactopyranose mutase [Candidatus Hydrogenisulfobacillus filiaventi]
MYDLVIVGAGLTGGTLARCFAEAGRRVLVVEKRSHIGGNAYDEADDHGVLVHRYGPHIFHTNDEAVWKFLSRFTRWRPYTHRVLARVQDRLVPFPINRRTLVMLYGEEALNKGVKAFLDARRIPLAHPRNAEEQVLAAVGPELYEWFFRDYTRKQWGRLPRDLSPLVTARIPVRDNDDDRYFTDRFQAMPAEGYHAMFRRLFDHPNITVWLNTSWNDVSEEVHFRRLIYTGPIDAFFDHIFGPLPYRSLKFQWKHHEEPTVQPVATINEPAHPVFTRTTEFKHMTGQVHPGTTVVAEIPAADGDPYYPIPAPDTNDRRARYLAEASHLSAVRFFGRLGQYRYFNMDQVVAEALEGFRALRAEGW